MKIKKIISAVLSLTLMIATLSVSSNAIVFSVSAAESNTVFKGVDVSRWNGEINWKKMKSRGVDFAILRCYSYGKDKKFDEYYEGATEAGLDVGAYIFMYATNEKEAVAEAKDTLAALDGRGLDYPLFLDIEYEKLKTFSKSYLTSLCITELEIFKKAGYKVGIYCSKNFQATYLDMQRLSPYYIWTAKWSLYSTENDNSKYYFKDMDPYDVSKPIGDMWQFSNGGYGPYYGAEAHYLDLDYCYVDFKNNEKPTLGQDPADHAKPERTLIYDPLSIMKGDDIAWVQAVLCQLGYLESVDGFFGPMTKTAVVHFQKNCGLAANGTVDEETTQVLQNVYEHRKFSANIIYDPNNADEPVASDTLSYGTAFVPGADMNFENEGLCLSGWTLRRHSDGKYYCTDGKWHSPELIAQGAYFEKVLRAGEKQNINESYMRTSKTKSDTFTFTAVWDELSAEEQKIYYNGYEYSIYRGEITYNDAQKYCTLRGGALAEFTDADELSVLGILGEDDRLFVGATKTQDGYFWNSGDKVNFHVSETEGAENAYLTVSAASICEPHTLFEVDESEANGFVMKTKCSHRNKEIVNDRAKTCAVDGYSGDKVCSDCGTVISTGETFKAPGHTYGSYKVISEPTCGSTGVKEKICKTCGKSYKKTIAKTDDHVIETSVIKKASTEKTGKATDKCSVCGLEIKTYNVSKIKSVKLSSSSMQYSGKSLKPKVTVKDSKGNVLVRGTDYSVKYSNNKEVGTATVTVKFKGKYEGTVTKTFKIVPKTTKLSALTTKNGTVSVKWKKPSDKITGYVLQYSTTPDFSKNVNTVKIKKQDKVEKTIKDLKKGKTVYFRIRTYKKVGKTGYYSKWSHVGSIKIK